MDAISRRLGDFFSWEAISAFLVDDLIPDLIVGTLVFIFFYLLYRAINKILGLTLAHSQLDKTARDFIQIIVRSVVLTIGLISALGQIGIDTGALLTSLGIAGLTLGFAAKDTLSNIISGLFIFWDRPFVVDDLVEIDGAYGTVARITMRSTRVVTVDGKMLAIPNSIVVNTTVASYTNFENLRLDVSVAVGVGEDIGRARALLLGIVDGDERYKDTPAPVVVVKALNDYNIELQMRVWIHDERQHVAMRTELREKMLEAMRAGGVEMPFETFAVAPLTVSSGSATGHSA